VKLVAGMTRRVGKCPFFFCLWSLIRSFGVGIAFDLIPSLRKSFFSLDRRGSRRSAKSTAFLKICWIVSLGILIVELLMCSNIF